MPDFENQHVKTRRYTAEDLMKRFTKPVFNVNFGLSLDPDDFRYEDTMPLYISMPRIAWKFLHGCAEDTKTKPGEVASEWLCDVAMDMFSNLQSDNSNISEFCGKLKQMREFVEIMENAKETLKKEI